MTQERILLPRHLSHSQRSSLSGCSGRYYLERGAGVPQRPSWASIAGKAGHSTTEELDRRFYEAGEHIDDLPTIREIFTSFLEYEIKESVERDGFPEEEFRASGRASKQWPDKENKAFWLEKGPEMVQFWVRWRDAFQAHMGWRLANVDGVDLETGELVSKLGIELPIIFPLDGLPDETPILGYVDRLFVRDGEDGLEYLVLDLKFGSYAPSGTDQLDIYRIGIRENWDVDPRWGSFWMARKGINTPLEDLYLTPYDRVAFEYRMANEQRLRGDFRYVPSNLCASCSVNAYCPSFGGEYADTVVQPWELEQSPTLRPPKL